MTMSHIEPIAAIESKSSIVRIADYMQAVYSVFSRLGIEERQIARDAFENYLKGVDHLGRKFHQVSNIEFSPFFSGMSQLLHTYLTSELCPASAVLGDRGKHILTTAALVAKPTIEVGGKVLATRGQGQIETYRSAALREKDLRTTEAKERKEALNQLIARVSNEFTNLLRTASSF
jgi:hypothetical protein